MADEERRVLTVEQDALLAEMAAWYLRTVAPRGGRPHPTEPLGGGAKMYVAKTPPGGIPAMVGDTPGAADCFIYKKYDGDLVQLEFEYEVNNLKSDALDGDQYVPVWRDNFGAWWALGEENPEVGTGTGTGTGENTLTLTQQECVGGSIVTTTYYITFPRGTTVEVVAGT